MKSSQAAPSGVSRSRALMADPPASRSREVLRWLPRASGAGLRSPKHDREPPARRGAWSDGYGRSAREPCRVTAAARALRIIDAELIGPRLAAPILANGRTRRSSFAPGPQSSLTLH